jgi:hypothetical protein
MGWFGDAFKVIFGLDGGLRAWRDQVAAAEHHLRWGLESHEPRDFERVLDILAQCPEGEEPPALYVYRRERAATEAHLWLARLALERLAEQIEKVVEYFEAVEEGRRSLTAQVSSARERVTSLEADGSLISAREERRRLEDMEREAKDLPDLTDDKRQRRAAVFNKLGPVFEKHREQAALRLAALRAVSGLSAQEQAARDEIVRQQDAGLAGLDSDWKALSAAAPPPPPASAAGVKGPAAPARGGAGQTAPKA